MYKKKVIRNNKTLTEYLRKKMGKSLVINADSLNTSIIEGSYQGKKFEISYIKGDVLDVLVREVDQASVIMELRPYINDYFKGSEAVCSFWIKGEKQVYPALRWMMGSEKERRLKDFIRNSMLVAESPICEVRLYGDCDMEDYLPKYRPKVLVKGDNHSNHKKR